MPNKPDMIPTQNADRVRIKPDPRGFDLKATPGRGSCSTVSSPITQIVEEALQRFRKEMVKGHGPISCGDNYPQEAESWIEAGPEMMEEFIYSILQTAITKTELATASAIALAAGSAGLCPQELTSSEDWKEAVGKHDKEILDDLVKWYNSTTDKRMLFEWVNDQRKKLLTQIKEK